MRIFALIATLILAACSSQTRPDADGHNCIESQGFYWSATQLSCINVIERADETLHNSTLGTVYILFSNNDQQVELFGHHIPTSTLLQAQSNSRYQSPNSPLQLIRENDNWQVRRR